MFQSVVKKFSRIEKEVGTSVGLNGSETKVITCLATTEELTHTQLVKLCDTDKAAMSRILNKMEKNELIKSGYSTNNKKTLYTRLTDQGKKIAFKIKEAFDNCINKYFGKLSQEDNKIFFSLFKKVLKEE